MVSIRQIRLPFDDEHLEEGVKVLVYTVALDFGPVPYHQWMATMFISSLQRSGYTGDIALLTNSESEPFPNGRKGVEQIRIDVASAPYSAKYLAAAVLPTGYDWVIFFDSDCLVLRSPEAMLNADADVIFAEEPWGEITDPVNNAYLTESEMRECGRTAINSGIFAVRGDRFLDFSTEWAKTDSLAPLRYKLCYDQPAFVRVLLDWKEGCKPLGEEWKVHYPECQGMRIQDFLSGGALHFCGVGTREKLNRMLGFYMMLHGESAMPFIAEQLKG